MENIKIALPPNNIPMSEAIQRKAFELGFSYGSPRSPKQEVSLLAKYLFLYPDGKSSHEKGFKRLNCIVSNDLHYFEKHSNKEIHYQDFLNMSFFDINNCKLKLNRRMNLAALDKKLYSLDIKAYGHSIVLLRDCSGRPLLREGGTDAVGEFPYGMYIKNGKTVMVGTQGYFEIIDLPEVTFDNILNYVVNKFTNRKHISIMGEIVLKCNQPPKKAKNITVGESYEGILINADDTQVDDWAEATHFLCRNNNNREAKYSIELFEEPTPPLMSDDEVIANLSFLGNDIMLNYYGINIRVAHIELTFPFHNHTAFSCGIKMITGINSKWQQFLNMIPEALRQYCVADSTEEFTPIIKHIFANYFNRYVQTLGNNTAFVLISTNDNYPVLNDLLDELTDQASPIIVNPNSNNRIKIWTKFLHEPV